ncbi:MAG: hypothetical protein JETCAE03_33480 [Ignavibacteriaceae bacterium]|nr:MAG: hypothetical protein JETCAE03_33480 [Ignavibacteriaceae bacterium]
MKKLKSHNIKLGVGAKIFDKNGDLKEERFYPSPNSSIDQCYLQSNKITIEVKDADSNIEIQEIPFRTFTYNYAAHWTAAGLFQTSLPDSITGAFGGSVGTPSVGRYSYDLVSAAGNDEYGILIGTGSTAPSHSDYNLGWITHGTGSNQLYYNIATFTGIVDVSGSGYKTRTTRTFSNYGSESVFVKEMGLVTDFNYLSFGFNYSTAVLFARDITDITGSTLNIEVPPSGTLTINYDFEVNPESGFNKNWITNVRYELQNATTMTNIINILSQSGQISYNDVQFQFDTATTGSIKGLVCGSGSAAVTLEDFRIGLIQNGTGAGQLVYGQHARNVLGARAVSSQSAQCNVTRNFTNNSGGSVDINEVAIYASDDSSYPITEADCWMPTRFLTAGITLEDGETVEFRFVFLFEF